jgi:hypothetical protein
MNLDTGYKSIPSLVAVPPAQPHGPKWPEPSQLHNLITIHLKNQAVAPASWARVQTKVVTPQTKVET